MMSNEPEVKTTALVEFEDYQVWKAEEPDGETTYHLVLNNVTVQFFEEEWSAFLKMARELIRQIPK